MFSKQTQSPTPESKIWGKFTIVQNMKHLSTFHIYLTIFEDVIYCYLQHISILTLEIIFLLHGRSNVLSILQNILVKIIKGSNLFCSSHHLFKLYSHFLSPTSPSLSSLHPNFKQNKAAFLNVGQISSFKQSN